MASHDLDWLNGGAPDVARKLLGCVLIRDTGGQQLSGRIVETEAYDQADAASHSYRGHTERTAVMFGPSGHLYVYFTYGMHYCMNVVCGPEGEGSAILIRAIEPLEGIDAMERNRRSKTGIEITNGPAKLCQALAIDKTMNGHDLQRSPLRLEPTFLDTSETIVQTTRIGINKAQDTPWRFYIRGNPYVSRV